MKRSSAWIMGAVAAVAIGVVLLVSASFVSTSQDEAIVLDKNPSQRYESPVLMTGEIKGSFNVSTPGENVTVRISDQSHHALFNTTAHNGTFSCSVRSTGKLFIVFEKEDINSTSKVVLTIHFEIRGITTTVLYVSVGLFVLAALVSVLAWRTHRKEWSPVRRQVPRQRR